MRYLLFPFAALYGFVTWLRNLFFDIGLLRSVRFTTPVLVVGNLRVGGTGKTPTVDAVIRMLKSDYKIAVLSRGYGRKTKGWLEVLVDESPDDVGDEPLLIKKHHPNVKVVVMENRVEGIRRLLREENKPELVVLDDAMQHRWVKPGHLVLLTAYHDLYVNDSILPVGRLREFASEAQRADTIVVTKCPADLSTLEKRGIRLTLNARAHQKVYFAYEAYPGLTSLISSNKDLTWVEAQNKQWLLVTGLADTTTLLKRVSASLASVEQRPFEDHHRFTEADMKVLVEWVSHETGTDRRILTTEKDAQRMQKWLQIEKFAALPIYIVSHSLEWFDEDRQGIEERLHGFIEAY